MITLIIVLLSLIAIVLLGALLLLAAPAGVILLAFVPFMLVDGIFLWLLTRGKKRK